MTATTRLPRAGDDDAGDERVDDVTTPPDAGGRKPTLILAAIAAALVVALLIWVVAFSPLLGAKSVVVRGTQTVSAVRVRAVAAIGHGSPLIRLDTAAVARRVEALPEVASATVRTSYPSTVTITVVERVAVGYLESAGRYVLVDKTGDQFRTVSTRPRALPLFGVPSGPQAKATGQAIASVAASLTTPLLARIASVQAFDPTAITLLLTDHRIVRWGSAQRSADKARILPALLAQPGSQFDLTDPDQPFAR